MKKTVTVMAALGALSLGGSAAYAVSTNVDANVNVSQTALEIGTPRGLSFGSFEITNATASGTVTVTHANEVSSEATGIVHGGDGISGIVSYSGTPNALFETSCTTSAVLTHETDSTQTMAVSNVILEGLVCGSGPHVRQLQSDGTRFFNVGGTLNFDSPITGAYSTANPGGTPITVDVVYQ